MPTSLEWSQLLTDTEHVPGVSPVQDRVTGGYSVESIGYL